MQKTERPPEKDPRLRAIWEQTPYPDRYTLDGVRHIQVRHNGRKVLLPLSEVTDDDLKEHS